MENKENINSNLNNQNNNSEPNKKKHKGLIIGTIIIIIVILLLLLRSCNQNPASIPTPSPTNSQNILNVDIDKNAKNGETENPTKEEIEEELNKKVKEGEITISMNKYPVFKDGSSEGNLLIVNEDKNLYPQVVQIYTSDNNELIYQSGLIPVGSRIDNAKLDVELEKGTYECYVMFNNVDEETGTILGQGRTIIEISILE